MFKIQKFNFYLMHFIVECKFTGDQFVLKVTSAASEETQKLLPTSNVLPPFSSMRPAIYTSKIEENPTDFKDMSKTGM